MSDGALPTPLIAPAPRTLRSTLLVRVLFGGFLSQFGWLFVAFGMAFVWVFDAGAGFVEALQFRRDAVVLEGSVTGWRSTSFSINEVRVYETSFSFRMPDGRTHSGASFETGSWVEAGETVSIEVVDGDPPVSRIVGMRASQGGLAVSFIFVFPLVGAVLASFGLLRGLKARRLMMTGELTRGVLKTTETTNTQVNSQSVLKLTFEFDVPEGGTFQAVAKTHQPDRLKDEARELIVYDPRNPTSAKLLDELPCQPRVTERGDFEASEPGLPTALYLLLPGVCVLTMLRYLVSLA